MRGKCTCTSAKACPGFSQPACATASPLKSTRPNSVPAGAVSVGVTVNITLSAVSATDFVITIEGGFTVATPCGGGALPPPPPPPPPPQPPNACVSASRIEHL